MCLRIFKMEFLNILTVKIQMNVEAVTLGNMSAFVSFLKALIIIHKHVTQAALLLHFLYLTLHFLERVKHFDGFVDFPVLFADLGQAEGGTQGGQRPAQTGDVNGQVFH